MFSTLKTTVIAVAAFMAVTGLFGFISSDSSKLNYAEEEYFFNDSAVQDAWMLESNWDANPSSTPNCNNGSKPCRITIEDTESLQLFLDSFSGDLNSLLNDDAVDTKK